MEINGAVGIVEVGGLPAAIACADAAVKTACVDLIGYEITNGPPGLVIVKFSGRVSDVQAAVAAGAAAADNVTKTYAKIVIPRPAESTKQFLLKNAKKSRPIREELYPTPVEESVEEAITDAGNNLGVVSEELCAVSQESEEIAPEQVQAQEMPALADKNPQSHETKGTILNGGRKNAKPRKR